MDTSTVVVIAAVAFLVGFALGRGQLARGVDEPPAPIDAKALELARQVLPREGKIGAIKAYREATHVGLRDAKRAVDTLDGEAT